MAIDPFDTQVSGIQKRRPRRREEWYSVLVSFAIQVEGQKKGLQAVEDRVILVRASSETDARRNVRPYLTREEEPYLDELGRLTRWKLLDIVAITNTHYDKLDQDGADVFSSFRQRRMRPEFEWHPQY